MDIVQIEHALQDVPSFLGVYASDLLPRSIVRTGTVIVNTDPHTEKGSHWQAIHFQPRSSRCYFFDSYGRHPHVPAIHDFIRRNSVVWQYNTVQLQGPTSTVCGEYCCLFALYMDRGNTPQQFVGLFNADCADRQVHHLFCRELGPPRCSRLRGGQCCTSLRKRYVYNLMQLSTMINLGISRD
jgi:hypothetical protein